LIDEYEFLVQPRLAGLSKRVDLTLVSRLYIPFDQPSFVVDAVREVYTQSK